MKSFTKVLVEHKHLIEPKPEQGRKAPAVGMEGKKSREWWSVHPILKQPFS